MKGFIKKWFSSKNETEKTSLRFVDWFFEYLKGLPWQSLIFYIVFAFSVFVAYGLIKYERILVGGKNTLMKIIRNMDRKLTNIENAVIKEHEERREFEEDGDEIPVREMSVQADFPEIPIPPTSTRILPGSPKLQPSRIPAPTPTPRDDMQRWRV